MRGNIGPAATSVCIDAQQLQLDTYPDRNKDCDEPCCFAQVVVSYQAVTLLTSKAYYKH